MCKNYHKLDKGDNMKKIIILFMVLLISGCSKVSDKEVINTDIPSHSEDTLTCPELDYIEGEDNVYCNYEKPVYTIDDTDIVNTVPIEDYDINELFNDFGINETNIIVNKNACNVMSDRTPSKPYAGLWTICDEYNHNFTTIDFDSAVKVLNDEMNFEVVVTPGYLSGVGINYQDTKFYQEKGYDKVIPSEINIDSLPDDSYYVIHEYTISTINQNGINGSISIGTMDAGYHNIIFFNYILNGDTTEYYSSYRYK